MNKKHKNRDRFIIGITGKIGSGKSLVRRMLERLGCLSVDADLLAHQVYRRGTPAYNGVVEAFGRGILDPSEEVNRRKLAEIVFSDTAALRKLEALTHPAVSSALKRLVELSPLPIIAVEAIKLFESGFSQYCDSIWLVDASLDQVNERLQKTRGTATSEISARVKSQVCLREKKEQATVLINNSSQIQDLWQQVQSAWESLLEKSSDFQRLAVKASEITNPFIEKYQMPTMELATTMADAYAVSSAFPALVLEAGNLYDLYHPRDHSERINLCFHLLCDRHVWIMPGSELPASLFLANFTHFTGNIFTGLGKISGQPENAYREIFQQIEGFCRLHLISSLRINTFEKTKGMEKLGFCLVDGEKMRPSESKAEYNVYEKEIMPLIDLFKEQED